MILVDGADLAIGGPDETAAIRLFPRAARFDEDGRLLASNLYGFGNTRETRAFIRLIASLDLRGKRVADIGSGTGILAILAARAGAVVTAYDNDERAREATERNAALNGVSVTVRGTFPDDWDGERYAIAFANLGRPVPTARVAEQVYVTRVDGKGAQLLLPSMRDERPLLGSIDTPDTTPITRLYPLDPRDPHSPLVPRAHAPRPPEDGIPTVPTFEAALAFLRGERHPTATTQQWLEWLQITAAIDGAARSVARQYPHEQDALRYLVQRGNLGKIQNRHRLVPIEERVGAPWHMTTINLATFECGCMHEQAFRDFTDLAPVSHVKGIEVCREHLTLSGPTGYAVWRRIHEASDLLGELSRDHPGVRGQWRSDGCLVLYAPPREREAVVAAARLLVGEQSYYEVA